MTQIKAELLTEEQQELFTACFYDAWRECEIMDDYEPDTESSVPYGCPWHYNENLEVKTNNIEASAHNYFFDIMDDIIDDFLREKSEISS